MKNARKPWLRGGCSVAGLFAFLFFGCDPGGEMPAGIDAACHDLVLPPCGSVEIPAGVVSACQDLFLRRVAFAERCAGPGRGGPFSADEQAYVDTCAGIATAPGVTLTPLDIKACAGQMDASPCLGGGVFPSCAGYGGDLLYPGHDKKGTLALGEVCFAQVQCDSGYCDHNLLQPCGVCKRARADSERCGEATDLCVEGVCREGTCQPPGKKLGEDCTTHGIECQSTLYCNGAIGKCVAYGQAGASCDASHYCAAGLSCQAGVCVTLAADGAGCSDDAMCSSFWCNGGTCTTKLTGLTEGADCSVGFCRAGLFCDASQVCATPTYLPEGAACTGSSYPEVTCKPGLRCHEECSPGSGCQGACRPYPQPGEHCTSVAACASGAYCVGFDPTDLTKSVCVKRGGEGEACPCMDALVCVSGVCVAYGACQ